jgi:hypothetical protein
MAGPVHYTYPQPPHVKPADPMRVSPGFEVPQNADQYTWRVTGKLGGKDIFPQGVPVYDFSGGSRGKVGVIPVGTEIKIEAFKNVGYVNYYQIPWTGPGPKTVWISGNHIEPASFSGQAPAR